MRTYLFETNDLRQHGLSLGSMKEGTYRSYLAQAQQKGHEAGFEKPRLGLTIEFKPGKSPTGSDHSYPINEAEWQEFLADEADYCRVPIRVFAYDAAKYALPSAIRAE
jgi:hypothetical protein